MKQVHQFKVWNIYKDEWVVQPSKRTAERIAEIGGIIVPGTVEMVSETLLDAEGSYVPKHLRKDDA